MFGTITNFNAVAARGLSPFKRGMSGRFGDCFTGSEYHLGYGNQMFITHGIILAIIAVVVIILLVRRTKKKKIDTSAAIQRVTYSDKDLALQILNKRYANSEIDDEEYLIKKQNLTNDFNINTYVEESDKKIDNSDNK